MLLKPLQATRKYSSGVEGLVLWRGGLQVSRHTAQSAWWCPNQTLRRCPHFRPRWRCTSDSLVLQGRGGMKPCMLCANLYTRSSGITDEDGTELLTCSVVHESELVFATDNTVIATVDRLAARKNVDSSAVFLKRQQIVGFNHEPHGCLLAPELRGLLRPVTQYCNDPQHTLFVSGVFNTIVYLFFETLWMGRGGVHEEHLRGVPAVLVRLELLAC